VVALGRMVVFAEKALDSLVPQGVKCDLIDPRTTSPLDLKTILQSVENTGRLIVVDESPPRCSVASDIAAQVASQGFDSLQAPVELVTTPHAPVPFSPALERAYVPSPQKIAAAIVRTLRARR
jgi:pyruvate dehydrogenase E1 component beta subunit